MSFTITAPQSPGHRPAGLRDGLGREKMDAVMAAVSEKTGLTNDELHDRLANGGSLAEIAADRGMSKSDLLTTIKRALSEDAKVAAPSGGSSAPAKPPTDEQVQRMAERLAERHVSRGHRDHGQGPGAAGTTPPTDSSTTSAAAIANGRVDMRL
ncbi:MAG: hypothetical protein AB7L13_14420 [Acidimicrobiia bacterium]